MTWLALAQNLDLSVQRRKHGVRLEKKAITKLRNYLKKYQPLMPIEIQTSVQSSQYFWGDIDVLVSTPQATIFFEIKSFRAVRIYKEKGVYTVQRYKNKQWNPITHAIWYQLTQIVNGWHRSLSLSTPITPAKTLIPVLWFPDAFVQSTTRINAHQLITTINTYKDEQERNFWHNILKYCPWDSFYVIMGPIESSWIWNNILLKPIANNPHGKK